MIGLTVYKQIEEDARAIMQEYSHIDSDDAVILASSLMFVRLFDDFLQDTLLVLHAESDQYQAESTIHEFVVKRNALLILIQDIGIQIAQKYPNVARNFFADRVDWFNSNIKGIMLIGSIKEVYDIQADVHLFLRLVEGGVLTNQLESALKTFEGIAPDYRKLYMDGLKALGSKYKTGRQIFDTMIELGRGVPMNVKEISEESGKTRKTVRKGINEILEGAGHLIRVVQRGQSDCYYIPEGIRRLHFR